MSVLTPSAITLLPASDTNVVPPNAVSSPSAVTELGVPAAGGGGGGPAIPTTNLFYHLIYTEDAYSDAGVTPATDTDEVQHWTDQVAAEPFHNSGLWPVYDADAGVVFTSANTDWLQGHVDVTPRSEQSGIYFAVIKPASIGSYQHILTYVRGTSNTEYAGGGIMTTGKMFLICASPNYRVYGDDVMSAGSWYSCVWLSTGSTYRLFLNGVEQTKTADLTDGTDGQWVGDVCTQNCQEVVGAYRGATPSSYFDGTIQECGYYDAYDADVLADLLTYLAAVTPA